MLTYIWSVIFIISSIIAAYHSKTLAASKDFDNWDSSSATKEFNWLFCSFAFGVVSLFVSWDQVGNKYWQAIRSVLPQGGTMISEATAFVLVAGTASIYVVLLMYIGEQLFNFVSGSKKFTLNSRLVEIDNVLNGYQHGYGIFKRIDENRELLELLKKECPEFLDDHFWIEGWLKSHDDFLTELALAAKTENKKNIRNYPRPWPGSNPVLS